jgi:hypothetical protein
MFSAEGLRRGLSLTRRRVAVLWVDHLEVRSLGW